MARLSIPPTKSNLLLLKRQLAFALEGYELLDQKRQILVMELMKRAQRLAQVRQEMEARLEEAFRALRDAVIDQGVVALDQAAVGVPEHPGVQIGREILMGLRLPTMQLLMEAEPRGRGMGSFPAKVEETRRRFSDLMPHLVRVAEETLAVRRVAHELRRTQRRCNALAKVWIPIQRQTLHYITGSLEERERESFVMMKRVRERLARTRA